MNNIKSLYIRFGGEETLKNIVESFYDRVSRDTVLSPLFPEDLTETKNKQFMFLTQFFGGKSLYSENYGHPMLRSRHMLFHISSKEAESWLKCMKETLDESNISEDIKNEMMSRFTFTAHHMINKK